MKKPNLSRTIRRVTKTKGMRQFNSIGGLDLLQPFRGGGISGQNTNPVSHIDELFENCRGFLVSNLPLQLSYMYTQIDIMATVIDIPVDDALRGGVKFQSKQLSEDQIKELSDMMDREEDLNEAGNGGKKTGLFGGGGILILIDNQDPITPLDMEAIGENTKIEFKAVDLWEVNFDQQDKAGSDGDSINDPTTSEFLNYYGKRFHHSRFLKMKGKEAPSFLRSRLRGWGLSEIEILIMAVNRYLKGINVSYEVMDEFKIDYYLLKGLASSNRDPNGKLAVQERIALMNMMKSYKRAVVMDSEDQFQQKTLSFAGLAEVEEGVRTQVQCATRIPRVKLFGNGAEGFSSGQDEIEVYNSMVESRPRRMLKKPILRMAEIRCQQLFGFVPGDLSLTFSTLRVLSAVDEETVKTQAFNRVLQASQAGKILDVEFREAVNKAELLPIRLDTDDSTLQALEAMKPELGGDGLEGVEAGEKTATTKTDKQPPKPKDSKAPKKF